MFEQFGFETITPVQASLVFAALLGLIFGAIGQHTKFCFRRGIVGDASERRSARGVWFTALATAIIGTQVAISQGLISFDEHRFFASELPVVAILIGGAMFGIGMVLTRGCVSRLTVLTGTGNLRALLVLIVFAIAANGALKGVFAPIRTSLGGITVNLGETVSFAQLPGGGMFWTAILVLIALSLVVKSGAPKSHLALAALLGLLAPLAWIGTGFILFDEFDPIAFQSLSFTSPAADMLFWGVASTAIPAGFGVGLLAGVVVGSGLTAAAKGQFKLQSFETPQQTVRYLTGAVLMGIGGVLAGGCTVGAGLSGIPTLSFAAVLAVLAIAVGAVVTRQILEGNANAAIAHPAE